MKKIIITMMLFITCTMLFAITGQEIMDKVVTMGNANSTRSLVELTLIDKNGEEKIRQIETLGAKTPEGTMNNIIIFHSPAAVKNTRFLTVENTDRDNDQWIFLPALDKVRRIASSDSGKSFMGTDFTFSDMSGTDKDKNTYSLLKEEVLNGNDCYVVESIPKNPGDSTYSKSIQWVEKNAFIPVRIELYDKAGELLKVNSVESFQQVQGIWTIINNTMTNVQTGHATRIEVKKLVFNVEVDFRIFSANFLKTGRI